MCKSLVEIAVLILMQRYGKFKAQNEFIQHCNHIVKYYINSHKTL